MINWSAAHHNAHDICKSRTAARFQSSLSLITQISLKIMDSWLLFGTPNTEGVQTEVGAKNIILVGPD